MLIQNKYDCLFSLNPSFERIEPLDLQSSVQIHILKLQIARLSEARRRSSVACG